MASIKDDRGYNQGFKPSKALEIRTARRCAFIDSQIVTGNNVDILEIGCGTGELAYLLSKKTGQKVYATDLCRPFIEEAKKKYSNNNLEYQILDFNDVENNEFFCSKKFDYIVGNGILHHLYKNLDETLKNLNLLLKENGKIIFLEPNIINPYCYFIFKTKLGRKLANLDPAEMAFTKRYISEKLNSSNFSEASFQYRDFLLPVTPGFLIKTVILFGGLLEKIPVINKLSQSLYITAKKN